MRERASWEELAVVQASSELVSVDIEVDPLTAIDSIDPAQSLMIQRTWKERVACGTQMMSSLEILLLYPLIRLVWNGFRINTNRPRNLAFRRTTCIVALPREISLAFAIFLKK
jgi:hypothetical protein